MELLKIIRLERSQVGHRFVPNGYSPRIFLVMTPDFSGNPQVNSSGILSGNRLPNFLVVQQWRAIQGRSFGLPIFLVILEEINSSTFILVIALLLFLAILPKAISRVLLSCRQLFWKQGQFRRILFAKRSAPTSYIQQ